MAVTALSGPRKIVELDEDLDSTKVEPGAHHLWKGKLWNVEAIGCVLCVDSENAVTFSDVEDDDKCHCSVHGPLLEVPYIMVKQWTITIGDVEDKGEDRVEDSMLFPVSMPTDERDALVRKYLEDAKKEMVGESEPEEGDED